MKNFAYLCRQNYSHLKENMKHLLILLFSLVAVQAMAQKQISVIDDDTHQPVAYAIIADSTGQIARTSLQGIAIVPEHKGEIIIVHDSYGRVTYDYDELPTVVEMHRRDYTLDEVEVVGVKGEKLDIHIKGMDKVEKADAAQKASGGNPFAWLSDKVFNAKERKRKAHLERLKEILDDY